MLDYILEEIFSEKSGRNIETRKNTITFTYVELLEYDGSGTYKKSFFLHFFN